MEAKWRAESHQSKHWDVKQPRSFEEVMVEYLRGSAHLRSLHTIKYQIGNLRRYFGGVEIGAITCADIKAYIRHRQEQ